VVISLLPVANSARERGVFHHTNSIPPSFPPRTNRPPASHDSTNSSGLHLPTPVSLLATIGLSVRFDGLSVDDEGRSQSEPAAAVTHPTGLPAQISWHSGAYFEIMDGNWRTIYQRKNHPVIVERDYGNGSLVLCSDSYFVSNEALLREQHADLLSWLIGAHPEIVFDETHFGIEEEPGVAGLLKHYHLQGVLLALAVIAGLFVWRSSLPLVPPPAKAVIRDAGALVEGKQASAGLASLLRRSLAPTEVLFTCFAEWKFACSRQPRAAARLQEIEQIMEREKAQSPGSRHPLETWQTIRRILNEQR